MVRVGSVEKPDDHPRVENDHRHSRRSLFKYPFG